MTVLTGLVSLAYPEHPIYHCSHILQEAPTPVLMCSLLSLPWSVSLSDLLYNLWIISITLWLPAPVPPHPQLRYSVTPEEQESLPNSPDWPQYLGPCLALSRSSQCLRGRWADLDLSRPTWWSARPFLASNCSAAALQAASLHRLRPSPLSRHGSPFTTDWIQMGSQL